MLYAVAERHYQLLHWVGNDNIISQIVRFSEVCDKSGGRVSNNDKCDNWIKPVFFFFDTQEVLSEHERRLQALTLVRQTRENLILDPLDELHLDDRL